MAWGFEESRVESEVKSQRFIRTRARFVLRRKRGAIYIYIKNVYTYIFLYIHIHTYLERERKRETDRGIYI